MTTRIIVTGTDTGIGKTIFAAALVHALHGVYWKPVQAGLSPETDTDVVRRLSGLDPQHILPEAYRLTSPLSPHLAAQIDGITIDPKSLILPQTERPLVIEAAGGLMVPLTHEVTFLDVLAQWRVPTVLCARTTLGTINHSLLSIEALRARNIPLIGIAFIGHENVESVRIIAELGRVRTLGRLPQLSPLTRDTLQAAFAKHFNTSDFVREPTA
jgi:dethiobiotin synthetase